MKLINKLKKTIKLLQTELLRIRTKRGTSGDKTKVLVVRLDGIGDFVLWLDHAMIIRKHYADAEITLLANSLWADAANAMLNYDSVIPLKTSSFINEWAYRKEILKSLQENGYDIIVQPRYSRDFLLEDQITRCCKATLSIAFRSSNQSATPFLMKWSDKWYSELFTLPENVSGEKSINDFFTSNLTGVPLEKVKELLLRTGEVPDLANTPGKWTQQPYFIIVPGAADPGRRWPPDKFAAAVNQFLQHQQLRGIICGSEDDKAAAKIIMENNTGNILDLTGRTTILQLIELIRKSKFVFSNDTGAAHIAAYFGIKSVCILGGGQWGRFLPYNDGEDSPHCVYHKLDCYGCEWKCIYPKKEDEPYRCVSTVKVANIVDALMKYTEE